jgi:hypothetical protein
MAHFQRCLAARFEPNWKTKVCSWTSWPPFWAGISSSTTKEMRRPRKSNRWIFSHRKRPIFCRPSSTRIPWGLRPKRNIGMKSKGINRKPDQCDIDSRPCLGPNANRLRRGANAWLCRGTSIPTGKAIDLVAAGNRPNIAEFCTPFGHPGVGGSETRR